MKFARTRSFDYFRSTMRALIAVLTGDRQARRIPIRKPGGLRALASRRAFACLTALSICVTSVEALIPDAHGSNAVLQAGSSQGGSQLAIADGRVPESAPHGQQDQVHSDHCCHAHIFGLEPVGELETCQPICSNPIKELSAAPPSVSLEPGQRPPIE